ncbi:hypothetical protein L3556_13935 [Candidatus Synechococcus calcipolaris G9]|uniref:Uncharacterized protein n=1 Tax=Candidatus Synechococcus calcipolaris G9 TaxID=1497997 RepID=A0ABT6F2E3_9SYNE|nr:hypothetical protein [Candidatus Synechococcus calcipolaris]MDG2989320.1 hypothetical protein [Candidatus Synechococcus calcipolaris G9]MDG2992021.1 hypothetical protein [Candidatus Synechococcus calcipolaris G9]
MTAFSTANIPSNVNTLEELAAWAASALAEVNPSATIVVAPGQAARSANVQSVFFENQSTNPERLAIVLYLPLVAGWRGQGKIWSNGVGELSATALPTSYTSN